MRNTIKLIFLLAIISSCQKFEQNNPFDSKCPKELWTPTGFTAVQNGTSVTLSWSQPMNNISGFKFTKKVDTGSATDMQIQNKGIAQFTDATLIGGKLHTYTIVAYAGNNQSDIVTATVTPKLAAGGVTTTAVSAISSTTLTTGGNITTDGGVAITARGVCWGTTSLPTIANSKTTDGTGTGSFTSLVTGLTPGASYFVRAYATNNIGTTYGNEVFTAAAANLAVLTTTTVSAVTATTATSGGIISSDGGGAITARGVCWSNTANPTIANSKTINATGLGTFASATTGLASATTYYVRAYATNSAGTAYGQQEICVSSYGTVSDIDGNTYQTVKIGTQIWTRENLKTTKYKDGTAIPLVTDQTTWQNLSTPGYCWYNNDLSTYKNIYGAIYNWFAVNTNKLCPIGWHVPTDPEWTIMTNFLGGETVAGGKLKETGTSHWIAPNMGASNESGFTALPGGYRGYGAIGANGYWWSSTEVAGYYAFDRYLDSNNSNFGNYYPYKTNGNYVRCISGDLTLPTLIAAPTTSLTTTSASSGGNISSDGGTPVTARGVCWSTTTSPTIADSKTADGIGTGGFTSTIPGLSNNTTYYIRAYATNAIGTAYSTVSSINLYMNSPSTPITDIDGNVYKTVRIGDQTWMAENLKVTKYRNGNTIPNITTNLSWSTTTSGAWCDWVNQPSYALTYAHLYNYYSVVDSRQLCPIGWHVPTNSEWIILENYLGGANVAGGKMKEIGTAHWNSPNTGADNSSGFTALPGFWRGDDGVFYYWVGYGGSWWTSSEFDINNGWVVGISADDTKLGHGYGTYVGKKGGNSIRCLKD